MNQEEKNILIENIDNSIEFHAKSYKDLWLAVNVGNALLDYLDEKVYSKIDFQRLPNDTDIDSKNAAFILGFCSIITLEILIVNKSLLLTNHEWEERVHLRRLCLIIEETFNENSKFGQLLKKYKDKGAATEHFSLLTQTRKKIIKNIGEKRLTIIRNTNAHFEYDIINYYEKISELQDIKDINEVFADFYNYIESLRNIAGEIGRFIDQERKNEYAAMQKDLKRFRIFNEMIKNTELRKSIMDKLLKDFPENKALHKEAIILMVIASIEAGYSEEESIEKVMITKDEYNKYKP